MLPQLKLEKLCTDGGNSLFDEKSGENLAFLQYPRPSFYPWPDSDQSRITKFMGYSVVSSQYRLTKWVKFNQTLMEAQWNYIVAIELYDHIQGILDEFI